MTTRAVIYARISEDRGGEGAGVERQRQDCEALAKRRGWEVVETYTDNDVSAYSGKVRPAYRQMLEEIKGGSIDVVIAWHADRLHRRPKDLEEFIEVLEAANTTVATIQAGDVDLGTVSGRMIARIIGATARAEGELKAARQRRQAEQAARAGRKTSGGDRPFGYEGDRVTIREAEAALIREATTRILDGHSLRGILIDFQGRGARGVRGSTFRPTSFKRVLISARIAGLRSYRGEVVADGEWPGIITREEHERLRAILTDPRRDKRGTAPVRKYVLTGLAYCQGCGAKMVARPRDDGARRYVCAKGPGFDGCNATFILAEPLEELVSEAVFAALDSSEFTRALAAADRGSADAEVTAALRADEQALEELARSRFVDREISHREYLAAREVLDQRTEAARRSLGMRRSPAAVPAGADAARRWWAEGSIEKRRAALDSLIERIEIGPAIRGLNRFDPRRVTLSWVS